MARYSIDVVASVPFDVESHFFMVVVSAVAIPTVVAISAVVAILTVAEEEASGATDLTSICWIKSERASRCVSMP